MLDCNTSFERFFSKLSENHKKFDIGSTILKLQRSDGDQIPNLKRVIFSAKDHGQPYVCL